MAETMLRLCLLVFSILLSSFAFCQSESLRDSKAEAYLVQNADGNPEGGTLFWPWDKTTFKCPSFHGVFSNPDDCSSFFVCVAGISSKRSCKRLMAFDKYHKKCLSIFIAICDKTGDTTTSPRTTKGKETTNDKETTSKDTFACPSIFGSFMHPSDCSKYYSCTILIPTLKSCPENELFDGVKLKCKAANEVNCGSRVKPTETTVLTTEPISTVPETTTPEPTTTTPEPTTTTPEPTTTTPEPTTTTIEPTTTTEATIKPTPPETDCNENDLDCIIDDTGVTPDWFTCPVDIGSYPHPISTKLFIFCLNWIPSVKKCGQDLVYSKELGTCVDP